MQTRCFSRTYHHLRLLSRAVTVVGGIALLTALSGPQGRAQTVFSDNFNAEGSSLNYNSFANWNVTRGTVDVLDFYAGFGRGVDMDGSTGAAGRLETKSSFSLLAGNYTLSFDLGKNGSALETMSFGVGSVFANSVSDALGYPSMVTRTFNFTVVSNTTGGIFFDHAGGDNQGYVLDNVSLVRNVSAAAPEPGTIALLAAGMPALGIAIRRRRKA